jgi:hypothetical protein
MISKCNESLLIRLNRVIIPVSAKVINEATAKNKGAEIGISVAGFFDITKVVHAQRKYDLG